MYEIRNFNLMCEPVKIYVGFFFFAWEKNSSCDYFLLDMVSVTFDDFLCKVSGHAAAEIFYFAML